MTYLGLGCWIAWNTIAFSGSFWLHETDNSNITENLMLVHLLACFITLSLVALFADRFSKWVAKNRTTFIGGLVAAVGTLLICNARSEVLGAAVPHSALTVLFNSGCVLSGIGTTMLFVRAAALFGTLPPHRALYRLAECTLFSIAIYFVLNGCPQPIAVAAFIALPVIGAALFCIRRKDGRGEKQVLATPVKLTRRFWVLLASIGLCSTALELIRAYVLISVPPTFAIGANVVSQLIEVPLMIAIMAAVLLAKSRRDGFAKMYSIAACALTVLIVCIAMFSLNTPAVASGAWVVCTCYNMVVWAMLYYLVYQWRGGALRRAEIVPERIVHRRKLALLGLERLSLCGLLGGLGAYAENVGKIVNGVCRRAARHGADLYRLVVLVIVAARAEENIYHEHQARHDQNRVGDVEHREVDKLELEHVHNIAEKNAVDAVAECAREKQHLARLNVRKEFE